MGYSVKGGSIAATVQTMFDTFLLNFDHYYEVNNSANLSDLVYSDDGEHIAPAEEYTKYFEIAVTANDPDNLISGTMNFKVRWKLKKTSTNVAKSKVYVNGGAISPEQQSNSTTYEDKEYDLTGINSGDLVQLYLASAAPGGSAAKEFRLYATIDRKYKTPPTLI